MEEEQEKVRDFKKPKTVVEPPPIEVLFGRAVRDGDIKMVRKMLKKGGVDINAYYLNQTALHWSAWKGDVNMVKLILSQKEIDVNTALHDAARKGNFDICCLLLIHEKIDITVQGTGPGKTPEQVTYDEQIIKLFGEYKRGPDAFREKFIESYYGKTLETTCEIEEKEIEIEVPDDDGDAIEYKQNEMKTNEEKENEEETKGETVPKEIEEKDSNAQVEILKKENEEQLLVIQSLRAQIERMMKKKVN